MKINLKAKLLLLRKINLKQNKPEKEEKSEDNQRKKTFTYNLEKEAKKDKKWNTAPSKGRRR